MCYKTNGAILISIYKFICNLSIFVLYDKILSLSISGFLTLSNLSGWNYKLSGSPSRIGVTCNGGWKGREERDEKGYEEGQSAGIFNGS